ncbi:hypothetical protein LguiA_026022 [Lonicera macranthoides]
MHCLKPQEPNSDLNVASTKMSYESVKYPMLDSRPLFSENNINSDTEHRLVSLIQKPLTNKASNLNRMVGLSKKDWEPLNMILENMEVKLVPCRGKKEVCNSDSNQHLRRHSCFYIGDKSISEADSDHQTVVIHIFRNSLKLKCSDAEAVASLHNAAEKFMSFIPYIKSAEDIRIAEIDSKVELTDFSGDKLRMLAGLEKIWEMKSLLNGNDIINVLNLKGGGPLVGELQLLRRCWNRDECVEWLKQTHPKCSEKFDTVTKPTDRVRGGKQQMKSKMRKQKEGVGGVKFAATAACTTRVWSGIRLVKVNPNIYLKKILDRIWIGLCNGSPKHRSISEFVRIR